MARKSYQSQLETLEAAVLSMADDVLVQFRDAVDVLTSGDSALADAVITGDDRLNTTYLDIERDCIELIARQQPVASDLRFIASSFKIVTDLERIGDLATNLARYGREANGGLDEQLPLAKITTSAEEMVEAAMDAYERGDPDAARAVAVRDDELDATCKLAMEEVVTGLLASHSKSPDTDGVDVEAVSRALLTIRDLERVGDHAVNISARTLYMVENDDELLY